MISSVAVLKGGITIESYTNHMYWQKALVHQAS